MSGFAFLPAKWGSAVQGSPSGVVTWSFAAVAGAFHSFEGQMGGVYQALVRAAVDRWESLANIDLLEVADSSSVNVRLGWDTIDGRGAILGEARYTHAAGQMIRAEIAFDIAENWSTAPQSVGAGTSFFAVALHEIGHVLGLAHTDDPQTLMYPYLGQRQQELDNLDAEGITLLYGRSERTFGGAGAESFDGSFGADIFSGGGGIDTLNGAGGDDLLFGNEGDDLIFGNDGSDLLYGGQDADVVNGGQGDDAVFGNMAEDRIFGNQGNDFMHGGQGSDYIHGGQGNDTLAGGLGDDTLEGGIGADRLVFAPNGGHDQVNGFNYGEGDRLDLGGQSYSARSFNGNLVLALGDGGTITLLGIELGTPLF